MFPKYFTHVSSSHGATLPTPSSLSPPPGAPQPPLLWSCLNNTSAAAELLHLARKSKERSEIHDIKSPPSPSPPPSQSPPVALTSFKPLLKFSVNAILSRDTSPDEDQKPNIENLRQSPVSQAPSSSPNHSQYSSQKPLIACSKSPSPGAVDPVSSGYLSPAAPVPRPFLPHPILPPHLHPLLYQHSSIPRTGFTLPGSGTTLFPLPGTFPWSSGFRGKRFE